jgi:hypothetical protein
LDLMDMDRLDSRQAGDWLSLSTSREFGIFGSQTWPVWL